MIGLRHFACLNPRMAAVMYQEHSEHMSEYRYLAKSAETLPTLSHLLPFVVDSNQVGLGIRYRYGRNYSLSFAQITLELTVVVPTSAGGLEMILLVDGFGVLQT